MFPLDAQGHDGCTFADVGEDGFPFLFQRLFHHGVGSVLLFDLFFRQLNDPEGRKGRQTLLILGHTLCKVFCIELADTDQVDVLHNVVSFTEASAARLRPRRE